MLKNAYEYQNYSIQHEEGLPKMVEIVVLVITRWHDMGSRMFLRNTLGSKKKVKHQNLQLLFVFGVPRNATTSQIGQIKEENKEYQDMVIPSE